jgi:hypothetical protein
MTMESLSGLKESTHADSHNRGATKAPCTLLAVASFSRFFKVQLLTSLHSPHFPCFNLLTLV